MSAEPDRTRGAGEWWWLATAGAALASGALWVRVPGELYLVATLVATAAATWLTARRFRDREGRIAFDAAMLVFLIAAAFATRAMYRVSSDWDDYRTGMQARATQLMRDELQSIAADLVTTAARALEAPRDSAAAFRYLAPMSRRGVERGVVLYRGNERAAWGGITRVSTNDLTGAVGVDASPFYITLYATAARGDDHAVATALLDAIPPADRLAPSLTRVLARRAGIAAYQIAPPADTTGGFTQFTSRGEPLFMVRPVLPAREAVELNALQSARAHGAIVLLAALACYLAALWRRPASFARRLAALVIALLAIGIVPLNSFSNVSPLFDPSYYFAPLLGPFTANVATLGLASIVVLLGVLAVVRRGGRVTNRVAALAVVLVIAGLGPFLLRDLARGIAPPFSGASTTLFMAWEVVLFCSASAILLLGVSAGSIVLGRWRGLPQVVAPALAALAALLAPVLLGADATWPGWYPLMWVVAIAALALTRHARGYVLTAAIVAGFGASALVWGFNARQRVVLAERDVHGLSTVDPQLRVLVQRYGEVLQVGARPRSRAELLESYVASDLAAASYPVRLGAWDSTGAEEAVLTTAGLDESEDPAVGASTEARRTGRVVLRESPGAIGMQILLAVPSYDGGVTTVVVSPRSRVAPGDPFAELLGLSSASNDEPPYGLSLIQVDPRAAARLDTTRWTRNGDHMHTDRVVQTSNGLARAHIEVELRPLDSLVQRGALLVLFDVLVVATLWTLVAVADGGFARWTRLRTRRWTQSYRVRLTIALFAFFVVPALVFAFWSYNRLQSDERASREFSLSETLRAVASAPQVFGQLDQAGDLLDTPLMLWRNGELSASSDSLYIELAPLGRLLRPDVQLPLGLGEEVTTSSMERVGPVETLFGYHAATDTTGQRVVLGAPTRSGEQSLDKRRRDLGVLVLFFTAIGGLAALGLSGIAARELARPIGVLRGAALAIAHGAREPDLPGEPPSEFRPVFTAFRSMARDLAESRSALEAARQRTEAVLRNVASGVVAVDRSGAVTLANPRAEELLGQPAYAARSAIPSGTISDSIARFLASDADDEEFDAELHGRQLHARLTRLTAGAAGAVLTLDDVTEIARAQRVLAWGEMARQVAHEIKNPLTPIRLGVQHLKRARADGRADFDEILDQNVTRILGEIDRLDEIARSFSRYGTAPAEAGLAEPVDTAAVLRDVVELERMGEARLAWSIEGADAPALALARAEELREVLLNVLENARLAGATRVETRLVRDNGYVRISVRDNGEGIPRDVIPRIFEPHFSTRTSGSGLGLAISRRLLDGWGGSIRVESEVGKGTLIEMELVGA